MDIVRGLGVPQLERLLEPLPDHASLLFMNDPGVEAETFLYQAAGGSLREGRDVVYLVANRAPDSVLRSLREYGFPSEGPGARLRFIDAFSTLMGARSDADYTVATPSDPAHVLQAIERAAADHPRALLVVDSLSTLIDAAGSDAFLARADGLHAAMKRFALSASLFTKWPYPDAVFEALAVFDGAVSIRAVEDRIIVSQYFRVERASWKGTQLDVKPRLYKSMKPGGVHVYVPKIVVTGPFNAGKSSFVRAVSDTSVSADHLGTTVALDHGRATMEGLTADIFGTPGQARFDPILRVVAGQAVGVILVVDSTKPDTFPRAREMLQATWRQGLPGIVAATKQDMPDALAPSEVARLLAPPGNVRVFGCIGTDRASGRAILKELIEQVLQGSVIAQ